MGIAAGKTVVELKRLIIFSELHVIFSYYVSYPRNMKHVKNTSVCFVFTYSQNDVLYSLTYFMVTRLSGEYKQRQYKHVLLPFPKQLCVWLHDFIKIKCIL